jgi:hypothetical protein
MRILTAVLLAVLAGTSLAQAGDFPPPGYRNAPPPAYGYAPPPAYGYAPPPVVAYGPPYAPAPRNQPMPPGFVAAPEGPVYAVPGPSYQAGDEYESAEVLVDNRRYYRECWWEWGYRRCAVRPRW